MAPRMYIQKIQLRAVFYAQLTKVHQRLLDESEFSISVFWFIPQIYIINFDTIKPLLIFFWSCESSPWNPL